MRVVIVGVSALALAAIPAALALGASGWLGFTITAHGFERTLQQEKRRAVYVAAPNLPRKPMAFDIIETGAVRIDRADLDGSVLTVYIHNHTHDRQCFQELHWALKAPDGTLIAANGKYIGDTSAGLLPGDRVEGQVKIAEDQRAVSLRLSVSSQTACGD